MLNASILDSYILSLLERGLETPYELQRQGGLSLGASTPALRRLLKAKLVTRDEKASATNRPRHVYKVTRSGGETARLAWKPFLGTENLPPDLDSNRMQAGCEPACIRVSSERRVWRSGPMFREMACASRPRTWGL